MMDCRFAWTPKAATGPWPAKLAMSVLPGLPLFVLVLLIGYVNADARRRGMRYVMWTWLAILIPNAIGIILYFVLREPLLTQSHAAAPRRGPVLHSVRSAAPALGGGVSAMPPRRGTRVDALRPLRRDAAGRLSHFACAMPADWNALAISGLREITGQIRE